MTKSMRSDAANIYFLIDILLLEESKKDLYMNTEVKMLVLKDLAAKRFAPQTSINYPRIWILRMQGVA
ncbi:hypothetical protein PGT21_032267 [Puccinia graminis f. sp. tritici]|uniref:Uncharacterized protein n=1 Tax=Puccinia graminis f. sp. tritici TaxID=56615 RepID=A0A5B0Q7X0_PUCGR|nr:hypothetical protein PGT21_032267 [Puccinia graminis f. sp. tritici]KAA1109318.1 hypothetical protein PGTUg99_028389 [Puccinia graminis f. sp. tritici]